MEISKEEADTVLAAIGDAFGEDVGCEEMVQLALRIFALFPDLKDKHLFLDREVNR